jgi:hypothetical protein
MSRELLVWNTLSATYRTGATIPVLYDPRDPSRSVVLRPKMNYFFTIGLGAASLAFAGGGLYLSVRVFMKRIATVGQR